jgi:hypothetical protein
MNSAETFAPLIGDVAVKLLGKPDHEGAKGETLRWRTRGSFKVDVQDGVWHDHEAKEGGGVLDLVMREQHCDKTGALGWLERHGFIPPPKSGTAEILYDYRDENGTTLFRVERRAQGGSRFRQHGPDGSGGFACRTGCMKGVRRVPYRLPELLGSDPGAIVFVCEGEKDADRLAKLGLVSTTNAEGAGKWRAEFAQYLAGRRVVILQDNDEAGRNHVQDVKAKLQGAPTAVGILLLPGLAEKEDVSDWLDAGNTVGELLKLAERELQAPAAAGVTASKPAYMRGISAAALMAKHFEPVNYVVPGLIAEGVTLFGGKPKIGKSWMAYDFALAIPAGRPVFGSIPITQGDVLYLALEDSERRLKSRLLKKGIRHAPERLTLATEWPGLDDGCIAELETWADAVERPSLVIVDVLKMIRGATRTNESLYDADYRALTGLATFARRRGIAVVVVHHVRKMESDDPLESLSGTNGLTGAADSVMVLQRDIGTGNCRLYVRGRDIEEAEKAVRFVPEIGTWELLGDAGEVGRTSEREAILAVLRASEKALSAREVADIAGKTYDAVRKTLSRMAHAGEVTKEGRGLYTCPNGHNVPDNPEPDIGTHETGYAVEDDDGGWIGESPAQLAARLGGRQ